MIDVDDVRAARETIGADLHRTPVFSSRTLGPDVYLKAELFQRTGSFKPRGVLNKLRSLTAEECERGVIGVSAYVREGLGHAASAVTGLWFFAAVLLGAPAVSLIGGYYVADLTGSGSVTAALVGLAMFAAVLAANAFGLRVSSGFQLALSSVLVVVMAAAIGVALPSRGGDNWTPFAPHGWWAVGTAANILQRNAIHQPHGSEQGAEFQGRRWWLAGAEVPEPGVRTAGVDQKPAAVRGPPSAVLNPLRPP